MESKIYQARRLPEPVYFLTSLPSLARCWFYQTNVVSPFLLTVFLAYLQAKSLQGTLTANDPVLLLVAVPFVPVLLWSAYSCHMLLIIPLSPARPRVANQAGLIAGAGAYFLLGIVMLANAPQWITISVFAALAVFLTSLASSGLTFFRGHQFGIQQLLIAMTIFSFLAVYLSSPERRMGSYNIMSLLFLATIACVPLVSLANQWVMLRFLLGEKRVKKAYLKFESLIYALAITGLLISTAFGIYIYQKL